MRKRDDSLLLLLVFAGGRGWMGVPVYSTVRSRSNLFCEEVITIATAKGVSGALDWNFLSWYCLRIGKPAKKSTFGLNSK